MLGAILYLKNQYKARFDDLKKHVENDQLFNREEYPRYITEVQSLLLNDQNNYTYNRQSQSNSLSNQLMFAQHEKTGDGRVKKRI